MNEPATPTIPVEGEVSATPEELDAKISEELGIPKAEPEAPKEDEPTEPVDEPVEPAEEEVEPVEEEKPPVTPATPSDAELFIEVEDGEGVTHKISKIEDLPEDFTPKSNRQIIEIVSQLNKLDNQREVNEAKAAEDAETAAITEIQTAQYKSWDNEIAELGKSKRIDATDSDKVNEVFGYMNEINAARTKAGNPNLISSFEDALDKFDAKQAKDATDEATKNETELAKRKSGIIGKSSAASGGDYRPYRAGSARTMDDIVI